MSLNIISIKLNNLLNIAETVYQRAKLPDADISSLGENIKNLIFIMAGVVALYILLSGGFKYVTSGGNSEQTKKAGQTILFGGIGLFIILISYTLITWVFKVGGNG